MGTAVPSAVQIADAVILVRPTGFAFDPSTALTNSFQSELPGADIHRLAAEEFDDLLAALRTAGIRLTVLDPADKRAPNAVFPNNWFSTHADGTVVLYPMLSPSRRLERDPDMARVLEGEGMSTARTVDLSAWEHQGHMLEGTGSLVLDRVGKKAFACLSERTAEKAVKDWCEQFGYSAITFTATIDGKMAGTPVYHTNVIMSIGDKFAVVCFEAMPYPAERQELMEELKASGKEVVPIDLTQMERFVGNMLQLRSARSIGRQRSDPFIFLSGTAFQALRPEQRLALQRHGQFVPVPIPTIEAVGGGSVRCMLAENFLALR